MPNHRFANSLGLLAGPGAPENPRFATNEGSNVFYVSTFFSGLETVKCSIPTGPGVIRKDFQEHRRVQLCEMPLWLCEMRWFQKSNLCLLRIASPFRRP